MTEIAIDWDGRNVPEALRRLAPGRYLLRPVELDLPLSSEGDAAVRAVLSDLETGRLVPLAYIGEPSAGVSGPVFDDEEQTRQALIDALASTAGILSPSDFDENWGDGGS